MARPAPRLVPPKGPSKSIFQPHPATVSKHPLPGTPTTSSGKAGKESPANSGKPA
jgi:hypothetical protein